KDRILACRIELPELLHRHLLLVTLTMPQAAVRFTGSGHGSVTTMRDSSLRERGRARARSQRSGLESQGVPAPSITRSWPTVKLDSGEASQRIAAAISSVVATRPIGSTLATRASRSASVSPGKRDMGVSTGPGLMALMRTPWAMFSLAAVRVRVLMAALVAAYAPIAGRVRWAPTVEATLTMAPPPWLRMWAISCFMHNQVPVRLVASTWCQVDSSK